MRRALAWVALLATCVACSRSVHQDAAVSSPPRGVAGPVESSPVAAASPSAPPLAVAAGETASIAGGTPQVVGAPRSIDNLTVFPILSSKQEDIGPITTLDAALAAKTAEVHEIGAGSGGGGDAAQVNSLVIENKGTIPV
ncbi:MAG TPA: DUF6569 family protein, partial [Polyangiaceae bacterium]